MSTLSQPTPGTLTLSDLSLEADLLHLLFHRNKNQHRSSKWWKWLSILRRNIKKLLDPAYAEGVNERLDHMRRVVVPSCYVAFTSVVANGVFAALGLVLLGTLARVHRIVGEEEKGSKAEVGEVVAEAEVIVEAARVERKVERNGLVVGPVTVEDFGEAIGRVEAVGEDDFNDILGEEIGKGMVEAAVQVGVLEEEKMVVVEKEEEEFPQEATTSETLLTIENLRGDAVKAVKAGGDSTKGEQPTSEGRKKDKKAAKKKKKVTKPVSLAPPRLPSPPPMKEELPKRKDKRKPDDKEGAKKRKKRKKMDEIDDLFAGLV